MSAYIYSRNKNNSVRFWTAYTEQNSNAYLVVEYGTLTKSDLEYIKKKSLSEKDVIKYIKKLDSTINKTLIFGKNKNRSNSTTDIEQAKLEVKSETDKKLKKGYKNSLAKLLETYYKTNGLGLPMPMLAKDIKAINEDDIKYPAVMQPKLNGHRCLSYFHPTNGIIMYSRYGNEITTMPHVKKELEHFYKKYNQWTDGSKIPNLDHIVLDGELYCHNVSLQEQTSWIKKHQTASKRIKYMIYDSFYPDKPSNFKEREAVISHISLHYVFVDVVAGYEVTRSNELTTYRNNFISQGYEGAILRQLHLPYDPGNRSEQLIKLKKFEDAEFKILDIKEGTNRNINDKDVTSVIIYCLANPKKDIVFEVTAPGTIEEKQKFLKNKNKYLGKLLTVKFFGYTKLGKPFHPVALNLREDI